MLIRCMTQYMFLALLVRSREMYFRPTRCTYVEMAHNPCPSTEVEEEFRLNHITLTEMFIRLN
jgi:hypothetical protein